MFDETALGMNNQLFLDVRLLSMTLRKLLISDILEVELELTAKAMGLGLG